MFNEESKPYKSNEEQDYEEESARKSQHRKFVIPFQRLTTYSSSPSDSVVGPCALPWTDEDAGNTSDSNTRETRRGEANTRRLQAGGECIYSEGLAA